MSSSERPPVLRLSLLTLATVAVQGYHLGVDDAAIYVPAIRKAADPGLYGFGDEFFMTHAHLSLFPDVVGKSARFLHLPTDAAIFLTYVAGVFLLLWAAWRLLSACFQDASARWGGVLLLAGLLPLPVAGTALAIMDPYVTARSLSTPATLLAIAAFLSGRRKTAVAWLVVTALLHPQMSVYAAVLLGCMVLARQKSSALEPAPALVSAATVPFLFEFHPAQGAAREALFSRTYFFVSKWAWDEWIGVAAPLMILWQLSTANVRGAKPVFRPLMRTLVWFGLLFTAAGVLLSANPQLENYARFQPMRAFHVVYLVFIPVFGALLAQYALRNRAWRWLALFLPLTASMWLLQRATYPASPHWELPGERIGGAWESAFRWIRDHTPKDAVFALDPNYMLLAGEDEHGFRAVAERSVLADNVKDSGAVSLFPQLAPDWKAQVVAQTGWGQFNVVDFHALAQHYPVTWIVTRQPMPPGLTCPYTNDQLAVCRL